MAVEAAPEEFPLPDLKVRNFNKNVSHFEEVQILASLVMENSFSPLIVQRGYLKCTVLHILGSTKRSPSKNAFGETNSNT